MLLRSLHPDRELEPYEVIPSWGGYPILVERFQVGNVSLPDYSALTQAVQSAAVDLKLQRLRKRNGQKTGRAL